MGLFVHEPRAAASVWRLVAVPAIPGAPVAAGGWGMTTAVGFEATVVAPVMLVAVTRERTVPPASSPVSV